MSVSTGGAQRCHGRDVRDLSVIVCTNRSAVLERFIAPLAESAKSAVPRCELIVVDDGASPPVASTACIDRLIRQEATGLAAARNVGADSARGEWLLYCDDDLEFTPDAIRHLWQTRAPGKCSVPQVRGLDGHLQNAFTAHWRRGDLKLERHGEPISEVAYPVGACFLFERSTYRQVGGCDERFNSYGYEDTLLGFSLRRAGVPTVMVSASARHHSHGGVGGPVSPAVRRAVLTNRWIFTSLALRGRKRATALFFGLPRTTAESLRTRSIEPISGYLRGLRRVVRQKPRSLHADSHRR